MYHFLSIRIQYNISEHTTEIFGNYEPDLTTQLALEKERVGYWNGQISNWIFNESTVSNSSHTSELIRVGFSIMKVNDLLGRENRITEWNSNQTGWMLQNELFQFVDSSNSWRGKVPDRDLFISHVFIKLSLWLLIWRRLRTVAMTTQKTLETMNCENVPRWFVVPIDFAI